MLLIEDLAAVLAWLLTTILSVNFLFLYFVFYRRLARSRYYADRDAAVARYRPVVADFIANKLSVEHASSLLVKARTEAERDAIQELLFAEMKPESASRITELLFATGHVERWIRQAFGSRRAKSLLQVAMLGEKTVMLDTPRPQRNPFHAMQVFAVTRALAVDHIARLSPSNAEPLLVEALRDPAPEVRRVAIAGMGRTRHPAALPLLLEEIRKLVEEGNEVSLRSMKSALVAYQLDDLPVFVPFLTHGNPRVRFIVIDTVREICNKAARGMMLTKNDLSPELYRVLFDKVMADESADVRARCADVVKHCRDDKAAAALRKLLEDENEFVRLHAVRACADRSYSELIPSVVKRLSDKKWRVREAAVRTLSVFGSSGTNELYRYFISTNDLYASEQIAEGIQRGGLVPDLTAALTSSVEDAGLARAVFEKMAILGKTSLLITTVASVTKPQAQIALMESLTTSPTPELAAVLKMISETDTGAVGEKAAALFRECQRRGAAAGRSA